MSTITLEVARGPVTTHTWFQKLSPASKRKYLANHPDKMSKKATPKEKADRNTAYGKMHQTIAKQFGKGTPARNNQMALATHFHAQAAMHKASAKEKASAVALFTDLRGLGMSEVAAAQRVTKVLSLPKKK